MIKWFICPDNQRIEISDCLKEGGCRLGQRCAFRSYLQMAARERPWTGKPSTTQLIKGTMAAFLELTNDYAVRPDDRAFMINGTRGHAKLESSGEDDECSLLEYRLNSDSAKETGIVDVIEIECGKAILGDNKLSGSYKVAKALGFKTVDEETDELYKTGKKKGQKKTRKVLVRTKETDTIEWELQENKYRIEVERQGQHIDELRIQCIVRDGNTFIARSRGVFRNVYNFKIPIWPDKLILDYFENKRNDLFRAIEQGYWNEICSAKENWDGLRCAKYCSVAEFCKYGKYLIYQKESDDMAIKGLSEIRRLPRIGKIRLGIKEKNKNGPGDHPVEIDYFKLDPQTPVPEENNRILEIYHAKYGDKPKSLPIMFPVGDPDVVFPQYYKRYNKSAGLVCKGDGEKAVAMDDKAADGLKVIKKNGMTEVECKGRECPYYIDKKCSESATLQVLLPELPGAGVWQIPTGSYNSIVNINSCMDYVRAVAGRLHMIPLTLERRVQEIQYEGKKSKHYILHISMDFALSELQRLAQIDPTKALLELPQVEEDKEDILIQENKIEAEAVVPVPPPEQDGIEKLKAECSALAKEYATEFDLIARSTPLPPDRWRPAKFDFARKVTKAEKIETPTDLSPDQWRTLIRMCKEERDTVESNISCYIDFINEKG